MRSNEQQVRDADGIEGIALRYGLFYGPEPSTRALMDMARARRLPIVRPGGTTSPIHIAAAAAATVAALTEPRTYTETVLEFLDQALRVGRTIVD